MKRVKKLVAGLLCFIGALAGAQTAPPSVKVVPVLSVSSGVFNLTCADSTKVVAYYWVSSTTSLPTETANFGYWFTWLQMQNDTYHVMSHLITLT